MSFPEALPSGGGSWWEWYHSVTSAVSTPANRHRQVGDRAAARLPSATPRSCALYLISLVFLKMGFPSFSSPISKRSEYNSWFLWSTWKRAQRSAFTRFFAYIYRQTRKRESAGERCRGYRNKHALRCSRLEQGGKWAPWLDKCRHTRTKLFYVPGHVRPPAAALHLRCGAGAGAAQHPRGAHSPRTWHLGSSSGTSQASLVPWSKSQSAPRPAPRPASIPTAGVYETPVVKNMNYNL